MMSRSSRLKDTLFFTGAIFVIPYSARFFYDLNDIVLRRQEEHPELDLPRYSDLIASIYYISLFLVLRFIFSNYIFHNLGNLVIRSEKWTAEVREAKALRFGHCFFKFLWFIGISTYSVILLRTKAWVPPILGGNGSTINMWDDFPFNRVDDDLKTYYILQLAYHSHSLIYQFTLIKRGDFLEMFFTSRCYNSSYLFLLSQQLC